MSKKLIAILLTLALTLSVLMNFTYASAEPSNAREVDVLFTHDVHSHLNEFSTVVGKKPITFGGIARLKTLVNEQKEKNPDTLYIDGGDFSMGTLIQTISPEEAPELRTFGQLGVDVTTLGNHEFDYRSKGLAQMLKSAKASKDPLPELVICNIDWPKMMEAGLTDGQKLLYDTFNDFGIKDYTVVKKGNVKIAVIGVFGIDSLACAPTCELLMKDPIEATKKTVADIKKYEDVDMIACVSHSGIWDDPDKSEDELLAKAVPDIDLIISGHTHSTLEKPIVHGNTYIVCAGEYGKNLGKISLTQKKDGRWALKNYGLTPITLDIEPDEETQEFVDQFNAKIDTEYLDKFGYTEDQVLCNNSIDFGDIKDSEKPGENRLGSIISDSYTYAVENAKDYNGHPVDVAIVPSGVIRETFPKGKITPDIAFTAFSLGIGKDGIPGYPLVSAYLTGKELKTIAEIDASVSDFMVAARLYTDGLEWSFNPNRMILNKVTDTRLRDENGKTHELENDKLYRIVTDLYSAQMVGAVTDMSKGLLSVVPKFEDGTPIKNYEDAIIMTEGKELKAWVAISQYMESFKDIDGDGIGDVPAAYAKTEGRKIIDDNHNLWNLIKSPNKFTFIFIGVFLLLILILVLIVLLIKFIVKKIKKSYKEISKLSDEQEAKKEVKEKEKEEEE